MPSISGSLRLSPMICEPLESLAPRAMLRSAYFPSRAFHGRVSRECFNHRLLSIPYRKDIGFDVSLSKFQMTGSISYRIRSLCSVKSSKSRKIEGICNDSASFCYMFLMCKSPYRNQTLTEGNTEWRDKYAKTSTAILVLLRKQILRLLDVLLQLWNKYSGWATSQLFTSWECASLHMIIGSLPQVG
jgi:hypothetical protein